MSSSQDHGGFEYVGRKQVIHENTSDLEIQIKSVLLESIVVCSEGSNPDNKVSLYGESQVEDPGMSQSTSKINHFSYPEDSCIQDWSEEDGGFLGRNAENTVEGESHLEFEMTENPETTDTIQSSDIALVLNKPIFGDPQVGDPRLSQSTASIDDLNSPENSCMEVYSEGDGGFLGRNIENNVEQQSQFKLRNTEQKATDTIHSSDIALVVYDSVMWYTEVEDPGMSLPTTSTDKLLDCTMDCTHVNGGFLESDLESNVKSPSQLDMAENSETADVIQSSDIGLNEPTQGCPQVEDPRMTRSPMSINNLTCYAENSSVQNWSEGDGEFIGRNAENNGMSENTETTDPIQSSLQVGDPKLSQSTTIIDDLLRSPENSCTEDYISCEGDGGFLGSDLENTVGRQSQFTLGKAEPKTTDTIESSDIALNIKESVAGGTQVEDPGMSLPTTSTDKLLDCTMDCTHVNGVFLESNVKSPSQLDMAENSETADVIQSSDISLNEPTQGCPQVEDPRMTRSPMSINNLTCYAENSSLQNWSEGDGEFIGRNAENNGMSENTETTDPIQSSLQVGDPKLSQSTTIIDDLLRSPENSCTEDYISCEGDGGFLGSDLENTVGRQSQFTLGKTEPKTTDTIESSDIALNIKEPVAGGTQDLNVEKKVMKCLDSQFLDQDYSPKLESVSELAPPSINQSQNEIPICENIECIIPKKMPMLELLILTSRESHQKNIGKKLAPVWKMIADHRLSLPFLKPLTDKKVPGYKDIVKRPMDLSTIKKGLSKGRIKTSAEFQRDVLLMLQNAVMYNSIHHIVHLKALEMQKDVEEWLQVLNEQMKGSETK